MWSVAHIIMFTYYSSTIQPHPPTHTHTRTRTRTRTHTHTHTHTHTGEGLSETLRGTTGEWYCCSVSMTMCVALWCSGVWDKGMLAYNYVHVQGVRDKGMCFCRCCDR